MTLGCTTITELSVQAVRLPIPTPHRTASGVIAESPLVLTEIHTDAGVIGRSIVFTYTPVALKPVADLIENMAPLIEQKPLTPAALDQQLSAQFRLLGTQGLVGMALAAIDMALWDAHAKISNCNLVQLFGGNHQSIPAYGAIGFEGEKGSAATAELLVREGFTGVKAKIGYSSLAEEKRVIAAIRSSIGDDVALMVDYNQSLSPAEAIERIKTFNDAGLTWIEEPTLAHDYQGHAEITSATQTPIQSGENWWNSLDLQHALDANASDYVMLDVMKVGGVSGWLRANVMCQAKHKRVSSHLWPEISSQLLSLTANAHWLEYCDWWNPLLQSPLVLDKGFTVAQDHPGTGMDWHPAVAKRYQV